MKKPKDQDIIDIDIDENEDNEGIPIEKLNWFLRIFTIGKRFNFRDFYDRVKKLIVEFFAIFMGVFLSLAVDQKREDSNDRAADVNNMHKFQTELNEILTYTDEHLDGLIWFTDLFERQYDRWSEDNDSVFLDMMGEGAEAYAFAPLSFYEQAMPFDPPSVTYTSVQLDGTFRFLEDTLENKLTNIYSGSDLFFIKENAYKVDQAIIDDFVARISDKWVEEIGEVNIAYNEFWFYNRKYIQKDFFMRYNLYRRLKGFEKLTIQLQAHKERVLEASILLDSIVHAKEQQTEFIYWVID